MVAASSIESRPLIAPRSSRACARSERPRRRRFTISLADSDVEDTNLPDSVPTGPLDKGSLRYAVKLMHPMLVGCQSDERSHGRLALELRLTGDETGTVVESATIARDPPLSDDTELVECVRTTLETLELPPMPRVDVWEVYYPLRF